MLVTDSSHIAPAAQNATEAISSASQRTPAKRLRLQAITLMAAASSAARPDKAASGVNTKLMAVRNGGKPLVYRFDMTSPTFSDSTGYNVPVTRGALRGEPFPRLGQPRAVHRPATQRRSPDS